MKVFPFGAKSENNNVVGVAATNAGDIKTVKDWRHDVVEVFSGEVSLVHGSNVRGNGMRDGDTGYPGVDVSDAAAVSLLVHNTTQAGFRLRIYVPKTNDISARSQLFDPSGSQISIEVKSTNTYTLITPDDFPILQWLPNLRIAVDSDLAESTPVNGSGQPTFIIYAIKKR